MIRFWINGINALSKHKLESDWDFQTRKETMKIQYHFEVNVERACIDLWMKQREKCLFLPVWHVICLSVGKSRKATAIRQNKENCTTCSATKTNTNYQLISVKHQEFFNTGSDVWLELSNLSKWTLFNKWRNI